MCYSPTRRGAECKNYEVQYVSPSNCQLQFWQINPFAMMLSPATSLRAGCFFMWKRS